MPRAAPLSLAAERCHATQCKGFAALTVQDIADRAMVNRATFYRHYLDKHDLLDKYMHLDWMPSSGGGSEERGTYARNLLFASDALLMGRETYEVFAKIWPSRTAADDGPGEAGYSDQQPP
jgi:hypothetical protein